jgi:hypothetical protein
MTIKKMNWATAAVALAAALGTYLIDESALTRGETVISSAHARVGRPATPVSYAGVARRTTRRAVAVGAAVTTTCVQRVDAYGRIVTVCN